MADSKKKATSENLIDPIYEKFSKSVVRALGSTEFYDFFMDSISRGKNEFQFSNRKMEKLVAKMFVELSKQYEEYGYKFFYEVEEEEMKEICEANGWEFLEDGSFYAS